MSFDKSNDVWLNLSKLKESFGIFVNYFKNVYRKIAFVCSKMF